MQKNWSQILSAMFTDTRFHQVSRFRWKGEIDGEQVGIALATVNQGFISFALNKGDYERLHTFKLSGKLDHAFIVAVRIEGSRWTYCGCIAAEEASEQLAMREVRPGRFGEFYVLDAGFFPADDFVSF